MPKICQFGNGLCCKKAVMQTKRHNEDGEEILYCLCLEHFEFHMRSCQESKKQNSWWQPVW